MRSIRGTRTIRVIFPIEPSLLPSFRWCHRVSTLCVGLPTLPLSAHDGPGAVTLFPSCMFGVHRLWYGIWNSVRPLATPAAAGIANDRLRYDLTRSLRFASFSTTISLSVCCKPHRKFCTNRSHPPILPRGGSNSFKVNRLQLPIRHRRIPKTEFL